MPAYFIAEIQVLDPSLYARYVERVPDIVKKYGGRYLVRGGQATSFSGDWNPQRLILIEFADRGQLERCFSSPEYREIAPFRERSTVTRAIIVEGPAAP
jgi:uncharacterized protein (DUF1330 family)